MKRRLVGLALLVPIVVAIPVLAQSCHRGGDVRNASGSVSDNLLTLLFIGGLCCAAIGLALIFGKPKDQPPR
jgi:hypothetical protein